MTPSLALKAEKAFDLEEGYFMILQAWHDINKEKEKNKRTPDLSKLRPALFWDTEINTINWDKHKTAVIKRVFERGNETEKNEISRFYGYQNVRKIVDQISQR